MYKTTIAGSLPKPGWLAEPEKLWAPWRLEEKDLERGKRDASLVWINEQEAAGIDIVTNGEYSRTEKRGLSRRKSEVGIRKSEKQNE